MFPCFHDFKVFVFPETKKIQGSDNGMSAGSKRVNFFSARKVLLLVKRDIPCNPSIHLQDK